MMTSQEVLVNFIEYWEIEGDNVQHLCCFQAVLKKEGGRKRLWQHLGALYYSLEFASWEDIFRALLYGYKVEGVVIYSPT